MEPILRGKKGIIFGALDEKSIAWHVALKAQEAGAQFVLTNAPIALRFGKIHELAQICHAEIISADATNLQDLEALLTRSRDILGGNIDFMLHSIGMSLNVRKGKPYTELSYDFLQKTLDISAISLHKLLYTAMKLDVLNEWGSIVALTYIAAQRAFPGYNDMAEAKALLEAIARNFGYYLGTQKKVRINTISQSPTYTTAGSGIKGFDRFFEYAAKMSPLGNAPAEKCAEFCIVMFSDYTRYITMQNIFHDGGFSAMGVSEAILHTFIPRDNAG